MDWKTTAWVFPGQGSQRLGMGKDFYAAYSVARETFEEADQILGFALSQMCFEGPQESLDITLNTQPALFVSSIAMLRVLQEQFPDAQPLCAAGHSLGEITALTAAGAMPFADGLRLVRERARLMQEAGEKAPGAMAALLGLDVPAVEALCQEVADSTGEALVLANDNCPGQIVISGSVAAVDAAMAVAPEKGARKAVKLAVSIAAHSPLMAITTEPFTEALAKVDFQAPQVPVYANATAEPYADAAAIPALLARQLTQPVRWNETAQAMISAGVETFVEIGSGDVLTGLVKRIDRSKQRVTVNNVEALQKLL